MRTPTRDLALELLNAQNPLDEERFPDLQAAIRRAHTVLREALTMLCPGLTVRVTDFFNHSFVPDAVLLDADRTVRHVFLRFGDGIDQLDADDIRYAGSENSVFIYMGSDDSSLRPRYELSDIEHADRCLLVPRPALAVLAGRPGATTQQLLTHAHGFLDADTAAAALDGDPSTLRALLPTEARELQLRLDS